MKAHSLDLVTRLARIRENEAGERVNERRAALQKVQQQLTKLQSYEQRLALAADPQVCLNGEVLRGRALFRAMATRAAATAEDELQAASEALEGARSEWGETRDRRKKLQGKGERERRVAKTEVENRLERARGSQGGGHNRGSR